MASRIHEIRLKLNSYVANLDANIIRVIESKPVSEKLIILNQTQMLRSKDSQDKPLRNASTGKTSLTPAYAKRTGKTKPNMFETGTFFDSQIFTMPNMSEYFVAAKERQYLNKNYGGTLFGVAPSNSTKAKRITHKAVGQDIKQKVFR